MKTYVKPDLYYEDFELSTHVATCDWDVTTSKNIYECAATADEDSGMPGMTLFYSSNELCMYNEENYSEYCWTNGSSSMTVFNS